MRRQEPVTGHVAMQETKQSNKANDTRHSLSAESGVMAYVQAPQHRALEDRSGPVRPVWSGLRTNCIKPLKPSGPISLRSSFHFIVYVCLCVCVCVVYVCLCVCACVFVCATARAVEGWPHSGSLALLYGGSFAMGHFPPCHMTALQPY